VEMGWTLPDWPDAWSRGGEEDLVPMESRSESADTDSREAFCGTVVASAGSGVGSGCRVGWPWLDDWSRVEFVSLLRPPRLPGVKTQAEEYLTQLEHGWF
jgi:hypothetical protein